VGGEELPGLGAELWITTDPVEERFAVLRGLLKSGVEDLFEALPKLGGHAVEPPNSL
jgi:hypothetical protein